MDGKKLNILRDTCEELQLLCHRNVNRILECMTTHPDHCKHLQNYVKKCIVMEQLCCYMANTCCNEDCVSGHMLKEKKEKCNEMCKICDDLKKVLSKDKCDYIRCDKMISMCKSKKSKKSKKSSKSKK